MEKWWNDSIILNSNPSNPKLQTFQKKESRTKIQKPRQKTRELRTQNSEPGTFQTSQTIQTLKPGTQNSELQTFQTLDSEPETRNPSNLQTFKPVTRNTEPETQNLSDLRKTFPANRFVFSHFTKQNPFVACNQSM